MSMSRKEIFEKAKKERQQEKERLASRNQNFSGENYEGTTYTALAPETGKIVRILGNPLNMREDPTDPKLSYITTKILADNGKNFRCVWPNKKENQDWILWRIYDLIKSYSVSGYGDNKKIIYTYKDSHPECFKRVAKNNNLENPYERGWLPQGFVNMNVIDRHDPKFHKENKHTKLLSKKASEMSNGDFWYEPGVPQTAYNAIWDNVVEFYGPWEEYDICVKKLKDKPWYTAYHAIQENIKLSTEEKNAVYDGPLTEEEESYDLYDLDKIYKITTYTKIKAKLGKFIRKVDTDFDKNFSEELDELVEKEQKRWKEIQESSSPKVQKEKEIPSKEPENSEKPVVEMKTRESEEPVKTRTRAPKEEEKVEIPWDKLIDGTYNGIAYEGVSEMTDEEKSVVKKVKSDGSFEYVDQKDGKDLDLVKNSATDFISPMFFHIDPLSGDLFE